MSSIDFETLADQPRFGDFTTSTDLHTAMIRVDEARQDFMELPANVRSKFRNNPLNLIDFLSREENYEEALELGLVEKRPEPAETASEQKGGGEPEKEVESKSS